MLHQLPDAGGGFNVLDEEQHSDMPDLEASFSVRLFPEGFSIGKPLETGKAPPPLHEATGMLYPYNRSSESFLRALDGGWIPGDLLEEIPCNYANGCITCEVLDYCVDASSSTDTGPTFSSKSMVDMVPAVYKITLRPTMESVAKDVSAMVDESWTYKDLMEVESRILKTAWPELQLDPKSAGHQTEKKALLRSGPKIFEQVRSRKAAILNRRLRWAASAKTMVKAGSLVNSKKIGFEMAPERLVGEAMRQSSTVNADSPMQFSLKSKNMGSFGSMALSPKPGMLNASEMMGIVAEKQSSLLGKRDGRDFGGKLDIKKLKQESPRPQMHGYKTEEQDLKAFGMGYENPVEAVKLESIDQQRSDENGSVGMAGGQPQLNDSQLLYQRLAQPDMDNSSWQVSGLVGDKDSKQEELLQRKRLLMMQQQKLEGRVFQQPMSNDVSRMISGMSQNASSVNQGLVASSKDQLQMSGAMALSDQILQGQQLARRRTNSLPKNAAGIAGAASPGSTINSGGIAGVNSPSTASMPSAVAVKPEGLMVPGSKKEREALEDFPILLAVAQRHGLPAKRPKNEILPTPDIKKSAPLFHELECALNTSSDEIKDPKGQRNMADSLVGGNVNARKTRFLQFQKAIVQGPHHLRRVRVRLVMCERGRDAMVEAVVQFGDDQDDETLNSVPHHVLPTMANAHAADIFAKQFCALLEKEGFELVEDQVQPTVQRGSATANAACAARPLPAGASSLTNNVGPLPSPRSLMNPHMPAMAGVGGMPGMSSMQPSSPGALASTRMPPPGNVVNRQISGGYLSQPGMSTSKPLPLDGPGSQLGAVQHPQQHQQQLHNMQRAQQMVMPNQLAQLNHNHSAQQLNQQMGTNPSQLQQFIQQQRQQQNSTSVLQRKIMLGLGMGPLGGVGIPNGGNQGGLGNMMGVNAMNNVVGMSGLNNVSASMASMTGLNNVGQLQGMVNMQNTPGINNLIGRPGNISAAQLAAFSSKAHLTQGRSGHPMSAASPNSAARDNLSGLNPSSQLHVSAGMMGQGAMNRAGRVGLTPIQRGSPIGSLSSPRLATSNMQAGTPQGMYLNGPQQVSSQQQFNLQQLSPMQQAAGQQQALAAQQQMQLTQSQQMSTQMQQQQQPQQQQQQPNPSQQLNMQQPKNSPQMLNSQTTLLQQAQPQSQQQQLSVGATMNPSSQQQSAVGSLGSLVGGPASPQLSSQNMGSVTSGTNMEPTISATSLSSG